MVKLKFIPDDQGYHLVKMYAIFFILISIAANSLSHCDKHQLLYDVIEISVWNLTVKKNFAMDFDTFIHIEWELKIG